MNKASKNAVAEVNSNNQQIMINRIYWLEPRQQAAEIASEIFDVEISVDIRYDDIDDSGEDLDAIAYEEHDKGEAVNQYDTK